jgi:hypothetical protein
MYKKFDDPDAKVDNSALKVFGAVPVEALRRALQGITNRVLGGTSGTGGYWAGAGLTLGSTAGFTFPMVLGVVRDGVHSTVAAAASTGMYFGTTGTMGANTVAKFLVCSIDGTSGTVIGPGNVVSKADYASAALAAAKAKLPDLPDGAVALGYVTLNAPAATKLVLTDGATTAAALLGYILGTGGTAGTAAYVNLVNMPFNV